MENMESDTSRDEIKQRLLSTELHPSVHAQSDPFLHFHGRIPQSPPRRPWQRELPGSIVLSVAIDGGKLDEIISFNGTPGFWDLSEATQCDYICIFFP